MFAGSANLATRCGARSGLFLLITCFGFTQAQETPPDLHGCICGVNVPQSLFINPGLTKPILFVAPSYSLIIPWSLFYINSFPRKTYCLPITART